MEAVLTKLTELQEILVSNNPNTIRFVREPSERVESIAVSHDWRNIEHISDPSTNLQMLAVTRNGAALEFIHNPSEAVVDTALKTSPSAIEWVRAPSVDQQLQAVKRSGSVIQYIKDPPPEVQLAAVEQYKNAYHHIKDPSSDVVVYIARHAYQLLEDLDQKPAAMQTLCVEIQPLCVLLLRDPSEELQVMAVKADPRVMARLPNPCDAAQLAYNTLYVKSFAQQPLHIQILTAPCIVVYATFRFLVKYPLTWLCRAMHLAYRGCEYVVVPTWRITKRVVGTSIAVVKKWF